MIKAENVQPPVRLTVFRMPGLSLRLIFLIVTASAFLFAFRTERIVKEKKIAELKAILGEVSVTDIEQFGIKTSPSTIEPPFVSGMSPAKQSWSTQVFLPRADSFRICFAGGGIGPTGFPSAEEFLNLESGYRLIELRVEKHGDLSRFSLLVDEEVQVTREFDGGIPLNTFFTGVCRANDTKQQSVDEPLEIIRNMLGPIAPTAPTGKTLAAGDGILVWIEMK